jgi:type IX secretion system PorP/SprF family membrane protein
MHKSFMKIHWHIYRNNRNLNTTYCLAIFLCTISAIPTESLKAQDIHFSQFFEAPLLRNPSLAGLYEGDIKVQGVYRDQWNSVTNAPYRTASLNGEYKMPVGHGMDFLTAGLQLLYDKAGSAGLTTTHLLPAINYHKSLNSEKTTYLSLGFMGGWVQKTIDYSKISTDLQYRGTYIPNAPTGENFPDARLSYFDGSVGMSFNTGFGNDYDNLLFVGVSYQHFNRPKNTFYRNAAIGLQPKYVLSGGIKFMIDDYQFITLQQDLFIQGAHHEIIGGGLYSRKLGDFPDAPLYTVHLGTFARWKDAIILVGKIEKQSLAFTMSYDINISVLKTVSQTRGGFEIGIAWKSFLDYYNTTKDKVLCPKF